MKAAVESNAMAASAHRRARLADAPASLRMRAAGFASAYAVANGTDPAVTWPSGLQAPGMDTDGDPGCLDYIWVRGTIPRYRYDQLMHVGWKFLIPVTLVNLFIAAAIKFVWM